MTPTKSTRPTVSDLDTKTQSKGITHIVLDPFGAMMGGFPTEFDAQKAALKASRSNLGSTYQIFGVVDSVTSDVGAPTWKEA